VSTDAANVMILAASEIGFVELYEGALVSKGEDNEIPYAPAF